MPRQNRKPNKTYHINQVGRPARPIAEALLRRQLADLSAKEAWFETVRLCTQLAGERVAEAWINNYFFRALEATGQLQELLKESRLTAAALPRNPQMLSWLAHAQRLNGRVDESVEVLRKAVKFARPDADLFNSLGSALKEVGEFDEALNWFDRAIAITPGQAKAHWNKSDLVEDQGAAIEQIESLLRDNRFSQTEKHLAHFSLYRHYEKIGEFDRAFLNLQDGNRLKRESLSYNAESATRLTDQIVEFFTASALSALATAEKSDRPLFIFGMPRSGTTLVEQILASHSGVLGGNELSFLNDASAKVQTRLRLPGGFPEWMAALDESGWREIGHHYLTLLDTLEPENRRVTDKSLLNFRAAGLIARTLPNAKMIHVLRDPMDVAFGCFRQVFGSGHQFSYDFDDIAEMLADHQKLVTHWRKVLPQKQYYVLDYQRLVTDPNAEISKLLEFCALGDEAACYQPEKNRRTVRTLSATQVRQPINQSGIGSWKIYAEQLQPLQMALEKRKLI